MDQMARAVEPSLGYRHELPEASEEPTVGQAMSNAACDIAEVLRATAIVVTALPAGPLRRSRLRRGGRSPRSPTASRRRSRWRSVGG